MSTKSESSSPKTSSGLIRWIRRWGIGVVLVLVAVSVVIFLAKKLPARENKQESSPRPPVPVHVMPIELAAGINDTFKVPGGVEPSRVVRIGAEVPGEVRAYAGRGDKIVTKSLDSKIVPGPKAAGMIDEGELVKKGQPLLYLDTDRLRAEYERALAGHEFRKQEFARYEELLSTKLRTNAQMDQARNGLAVAKAILDLAAVNLQRAYICAPGPGMLNVLPVEIGEYVTKGMTVAEIVEMDPAKVIVDVPERDTHYMALGQEQAIAIRHGGQVIENIVGKVSYISELADPITRTTRIEILIPNPKDAEGGRRLRSGQIVLAKLRRRIIKEAIMIPLRAVIPTIDENGQSRYVVYLVEDGKAQRREVQLDRAVIQGDKIRIRAGLKPGEALIVEGNRFVGPGQVVRVVPKASPKLPRDESAPKAPAEKPTVTQPANGS